MKNTFRISEFGLRIWGLAILFAIAAPLLGTTVKRMDLPELVKTSDRIVQGRVEGIEVRLDTHFNLPFTWVRLRVDDPMKGDRQQTILLKHVGGRIDTPNGPLFVTSAGTPQFQLGDNVILFLRKLDDGSHQVLGVNQGKYEVVDQMAVMHVSGVEMIDPRTGALLPSGFVEKAPVDAFKARIRELLK